VRHLSGRNLPALDAVRAAGAFLVIAFHFGFSSIPGPTGVLIFYVLSGFLITWLLLREHGQTGSVSLKGFYIRRALRIFPAFYFYWVAVMALRLALDKPIDWGQAVSSFFYVNNYYQGLAGDHLRSPLSHTWSLAVEEQFYLLWPLGFLLVLRSRRGPALWLPAAIIGVWIYRSILHAGFKVSSVYIYEGFEARADHLLVGCLLAFALRRGWWTGFWRACCGHPALALLPIAGLGLSTLAHQRLGNDYRFLAAFVLDPLLVAVLLAQLIAFSDSPWWSWLNARWLRYLGTISYSTYLWQQPILDPVRRLLDGWPMASQLMVALALIYGVATGSYYLIEKPFLRLKERFSPAASAHAASFGRLERSLMPDAGVSAGSTSGKPLKNLIPPSEQLPA
jgi:peptidoglycan/LPS O-acetylase OafA/YrhL